MNEAKRKAQNAAKLTECFPKFAARMAKVIQTLEAAGVRPRIQDAWRSPEDQLKAFNNGFSKLKFGLHNVTGADGKKESLAVDLLDDDAPLTPSTAYLLKLAAAARSAGLETGILWGLTANLQAGVEAALAAKNFAAPVKVGWDPTHTQVVGISSAAAKAGARPT